MHAIAVAAAVVLSQAGSDQLGPMLQRGSLVLVEDSADGKFGNCSGIVTVDAPPEKVWATVLAMDKFSDFMPKVLTSEITHRDTNEFDIHFVLDVPGPDTDYTIRFAVDEKKKQLKGTWLKGDLKGSTWLWRVEPGAGGKTLLTQQLAVKNFSPVLQSVEDDQQTMTIGVNVGSALAATKAVKRRAEGKATVKKD